MAAGHLAFLVQIIGNTLIITFGALISFGVPCLLVLRLYAFDAASITAHSPSNEDLEGSMARHTYMWKLILEVPILPIAFAYTTASYYFYVEVESVAEAVFKSATLIVGASIAVAGVGMVVLLLDRRLGGLEFPHLARQTSLDNVAQRAREPYVDEVRSSVQDVD